MADIKRYFLLLFASGLLALENKTLSESELKELRELRIKLINENILDQN